MDRFAVLVLITAIAFTALAAGASPDSIPVAGAILPFTGAQAGIASEEKNATELALGDSGSDLIIEYRDSKNQAPDAIGALQELMDENVSVVIVSSSWVSNAIDPLAAQKGIAQLSIASAMLNRSGKSRDVQFTMNVDDESRVLLKYLENRSSVAVIYMDNDFGRGWMEALRAGLGSRLKAAEKYSPSQTIYAGELERIRAAAPDALVILSGREGTAIARQAREIGISCQIAGTRPIESREMLSEPAMDGAVFTSMLLNESHPFVAMYRERYGQEPTVVGAEAYDALTTLAMAEKECDGKSDCIYQWYLGRNYSGALGEIRFDKNGRAHYPVVLKVVRGGKIIAL